MRYLKLAWVFVIMMVVVSAAFNFSFGWRLGEYSYSVTAQFHDGWVYGLLSLAGDGLKIVSGVLTVVCLTARTMPLGLRVLGTVTCGFLFVCATAYSLNSAIGSISTNRTDMAGVREAKATNYDAVKVQLERVQKELSWLDQGYRASAAIEADMAGMRQSSLWSRTAGCANATVDESRSFCQRYSAYKAELGTSRRAEELDAKATKLSEQLAGMGGAIVADPHAKMLNLLTGYEQPTIVLAWLLLVVALVEGGSTLGPIALSMAHRALLSREVEATAAKSEPITLAGSRLSPQPVALPAAVRTPLEETRRKMAAMKEAEVITDAGKNLPEPESKALTLAIAENASAPDPDGPGTPAPAPEEPKVEEVAEERKGVSLVWDNGAPPVAPRANKRAHKPEGKVESWLGATTTQVDDPNVKTSSADCWRSYLAYCEDAGKQPIGRKLFSRKLGVLLGRASGKGRKRDSKGSVFTGLMINPVMATARRRVA